MVRIPDFMRPDSAVTTAPSHQRETELPATIESIAVVTDMIDELLDEVSCPFRSRTQVQVALDEILSNVVNYAYPLGQGLVRIRASVFDHPSRIEIDVSDEGIAFDPLSVPAPDTTLPLEERKVGGLGIMLVKKMMDEVRYVREGHRNRLILRKEL